MDSDTESDEILVQVTDSKTPMKVNKTRDELIEILKKYDQDNVEYQRQQAKEAAEI